MKIYFAGSIRGGRDDQEKYAKIVGELKSLGHEVLSEHVSFSSISEMGEPKDSRKIFEQDVKWIEESDMIIAEVTQPSLGVGYELGIAEKMDIKVVALFDSSSGRSLSAMVDGNPHYTVYKYDNIDRAIEFVKQEIST